jgi:two-component sensor histidine kinase
MVASARQLNSQEPPISGDRYRRLFNAMSAGFVICEAICDDQGRLVDYWLRDANPAFLRRNKAGRRMLNRQFTELVPRAPSDWFHACDQVLRTGEPARFERWDQVGDRWYDVHVTRLSETELAQVFVDITEQKRAQAFQAELFSELNHRVKNNLAIISGLLSMQARNAEDPEVSGQLLKAVDRIHAIADVHTSLYRQGAKDKVDFAVYLGALCERISGSMFEAARIRLEVDAYSATIPVAQAVPLGVIVNELITNAVKHAYAPPTSGVVTVTFRSTKGGMTLDVADQGVGIPIDVMQGAGGLGMRLVRSMVRQLGGELRCRSEGGAHFEVRLPLDSGTELNAPIQARLL